MKLLIYKVGSFSSTSLMEIALPKTDNNLPYIDTTLKSDILEV